MTESVYNIVYIDDEKEICQIFIENFEKNNIKIYAFFKLDNIFEKVHEIKPDLIILDQQLPYITGDELAFKFDEKIPKILVSGNFKLNLKYKFLKVLSKPFDYEQIENMLDSLSKGQSI